MASSSSSSYFAVTKIENKRRLLCEMQYNHRPHNLWLIWIQMQFAKFEIPFAKHDDLKISYAQNINVLWNCACPSLNRCNCFHVKCFHFKSFLTWFQERMNVFLCAFLARLTWFMNTVCFSSVLYSVMHKWVRYLFYFFALASHNFCL